MQPLDLNRRDIFKVSGQEVNNRTLARIQQNQLNQIMKPI